MAYPEHVLLSFGGLLSELGNFDEIWQCNVRATGASGGYVDNPQTYLNEVHAAISTWWSAAGHAMASTSSLQYLKCNNINAAGHYADAGAAYEYLYSPTVPGGGTAQVPSFCSVVFSWRTVISRGPGSHGRIYPPNYCFTPYSGGAGIGSNDVITARNSAVALLTVLANASGTMPLTPSVVSKSAGTSTPINRVGIGTLYGYQSRRKNAATEVYSFVNWP
jgi:hypothetical protein